MLRRVICIVLLVVCTVVLLPLADSHATTSTTPSTSSSIIDSSSLKALSDAELIALSELISEEKLLRGIDAFIELKSGDKGQSVIYLQTKLNFLGFSSLTINGKYDQKTKEAVIKLQKLMGIKGTGIASVELQKALAEGTAPTPSPKPTPKPTPTPRPTKTPKPTATPFIEPRIPLELTNIRVRFNSADVPEVFVSVKNLSHKKSITAFTFATRCYDAYGNLLKAHGFGDSTEYWIWQEGIIKPKAKWSSNNWRWTLYGFDTAYKIEVWLTDLIADGRTITIPDSEKQVWEWSRF